MRWSGASKLAWRSSSDCHLAGVLSDDIELNAHPWLATKLKSTADSSSVRY